MIPIKKPKIPRDVVYSPEIQRLINMKLLKEDLSLEENVQVKYYGSQCVLVKQLKNSKQ